MDARVKARRYKSYDTFACLNTFVEIEASSRAWVILEEKIRHGSGSSTLLYLSE